MNKALGNAPNGHLPLCVERKVALVRIYINSWANGLVGWSGPWKEKDWHIGKKRSVNGSIMYESCILVSVSYDVLTSWWAFQTQ